MIKFAKWFNDSKVISFLFTPWRIKRFYRTYQRFRICERCFGGDTNVHWSKDDIELSYEKCDGCPITPIIIYGHTWLCDMCFYGDILGLKNG